MEETDSEVNQEVETQSDGDKMKQTKGEALLQAVRDTPVGSDVIIHNSNMQIWCILKVIAKEHDEDPTDDGGFIFPK